MHAFASLAVYVSIKASLSGKTQTLTTGAAAKDAGLSHEDCLVALL